MDQQAQSQAASTAQLQQVIQTKQDQMANATSSDGATNYINGGDGESRISTSTSIKPPWRV
eukprot:6292132-Amphidinium_carterae.3